MELVQVILQQDPRRKAQRTEGTDVGGAQDVTAGLAVTVQVRLRDSVVVARLAEVLFDA